MPEQENSSVTIENAAAGLSREELAERWMRSAADFENLRKRFRRELGAARAEERASLLRAFAQVADNLERAAAAPDLSREDLAGAVSSIGAQASALMKSFSAEPFEPLGEPFNPAEHEALETVDIPGRPEGEIARVFEKGYRMESGTILRPARVAVVRRAEGGGEIG